MNGSAASSPIQPSSPVHYATQLPGVQLFRERSSLHHYRVWHEDWYAVCVVDSGAAELRYRGRTLTVVPESVAIFAPGNVHETRRILTAGAYWVLLISAAQVHARMQLLGKSELQLKPLVWTTGNVVKTARALCAALAAPETSLLERQLRQQALLDCMAALDARLDPALVAAEGGELSLVQRVRKCLVRRAHDCNTSLTSLAREVGCSPAYLSKAFSVSQACPPKTLLRLVRVERARRFLVENRDALIKQAGLQAGFRSAEKFNRAFHDAWNLSPSDYLGLLKANEDHGRHEWPQ